MLEEAASPSLTQLVYTDRLIISPRGLSYVNKTTPTSNSSVQTKLLIHLRLVSQYSHHSLFHSSTICNTNFTQVQQYNPRQRNVCTVPKQFTFHHKPIMNRRCTASMFIANIIFMTRGVCLKTSIRGQENRTVPWDRFRNETNCFVYSHYI